MRINEQITIIIRRHSAAVVDVYRHGVLVWKASEPHSGVSKIFGDSAPNLGKPVFAYRKEVQDYFHACERLLTAAVSLDHLPLSKEELEIIVHDADEVLTAIPRATFVQASDALLKIDDLPDAETVAEQEMVTRLSENLLNSGPNGKP